MSVKSSPVRVLLALALAVTPPLAVTSAVAPGCASHQTFTCPNYDPDRVAPDGEKDPCCERTPSCMDGGADAAADGDAAGPPGCAGQCVPEPPLGWWGPALIAIEPTGTATACPSGTRSGGLAGYHGASDLDAGPFECGACSCVPEGGCGPPQLTASTSPCAAGGGWTMPFDFPPAWDAGCTSASAIPPGSVQSVTVTPVAVTASCAPVTADAGAPPPPSFGSDVVACEAVADATCGDLVHVCAPAVAPPFRTCVYTPGDMGCPAEWPDRESITSSYTDTRGCTPCACGAAEGAECTGTLAIFSDGACSTTDLLMLAPIGSAKSECWDVYPTDAALGSKSISALTYTPGKCAASGGQPTGELLPSGIATVCCLP